MTVSWTDWTPYTTSWYLWGSLSFMSPVSLSLLSYLSWEKKKQPPPASSYIYSASFPSLRSSSSNNICPENIYMSALTFDAEAWNSNMLISRWPAKHRSTSPSNCDSRAQRLASGLHHLCWRVSQSSCPLHTGAMSAADLREHPSMLVIQK